MKIIKSTVYFIYQLFMVCMVGLLWSQSANAWGIVGHHTSAQIALDILTEQKSPALKQIQTILMGDDFVTASTWADEIRGVTAVDWSATHWYHFEKMGDNDQYVPYLKALNPEDRAHGGVVSALLASEVMLKDRKSSAEDKNHALKFMIHFIGDIHQPLHTGRAEDKGGNQIIIKWQGFTLSLHQIWDSQIMALGHAPLFAQGDKSQQIQAYAHFLRTQFKDAILPNENNLEYGDWIEESLVPRTDAYKYKDEEAKDYTARFIHVVDQRIYMAGVRIAFTLNRLFPGYQGDQAPDLTAQNKMDNFRNQVVAVTGDLNQFIHLKPIPLKTGK